MLRWEADIPMSDEQREQLHTFIEGSMRLAGACVYRDDEDAVTILLCCTEFPARVHREVALWLCIHDLAEEVLSLAGAGGHHAGGDEADTPEAAGESAQAMQESAEWWNTVNPMTLTQARQHRTRLQTILKRRQYAALAGCVSRELRGEQELSRMCFAFVPLLIEAI